MVKQVTPESIILIPVPEATPLVYPYRLHYDPSAPANVPEHLTLLYPFLRPDKIDGAVLSMLRATFSAVSPFPFTLRRTAWFEQGVLYLAPEPATPFVTLTQHLSHMFNILPFGGLYAEPTPHLTIAQHGPKDILTEIATAISVHAHIW